MRAALIAFALLLTALAQVTVAPLFPVSGAVVELPLIVLLLLAVFVGPTAVMFGLPVLALCLSFAANIEFEWLLLASLPILPIASWLERPWALLLNRYMQTLSIALAVGIWARALLATVAMASGADLAIALVVTDVILPGMLLDGALLSFAYLACRSVGWEARSMELQRAGF